MGWLLTQSQKANPDWKQRKGISVVINYVFSFQKFYLFVEGKYIIQSISLFFFLKPIESILFTRASNLPVRSHCSTVHLYSSNTVNLPNSLFKKDADRGLELTVLQVSAVERLLCSASIPHGGSQLNYWFSGGNNTQARDIKKQSWLLISNSIRIIISVHNSLQCQTSSPAQSQYHITEHQHSPFERHVIGMTYSPFWSKQRCSVLWMLLLKALDSQVRTFHWARKVVSVCSNRQLNSCLNAITTSYHRVRKVLKLYWRMKFWTLFNVPLQ